MKKLNLVGLIGELNDRVKKNQHFLRGMEVLFIIIGIIIALCGIFQVNRQIRQINQQTYLLAEQNNVARDTYERGKRFEEMQLLQNIALYFETEPNRSILEFLRTRNNEELRNYSEKQMIDMLDKFEYLGRLREEGYFKDEDIRVNFLYAIDIVCGNDYLMGPNGVIEKHNGSYGGLKKLCDM